MAERDEIGRTSSMQGETAGRGMEMERLVLRADPLNRETGERALADDVTATGAHYVRSHFPVPRLDAATHRVEVRGAVGQALSLSLEMLQQLPRRTMAVTMECAGNGRIGMAPLPPGEPWAYGAVSTAVWTGTPLREVLHRAGLRDDACEILCVGADTGRPEGQAREMSFARTLPVGKALDPDTLIAYAMNGRPLSDLHGAPVRLVVPGWYGVASVKWLARIEALVKPFDGYFQRERYVYTSGDGDAVPVTAMRVRSMITSPRAGAMVQRGRVRVDGRAWSGDGGIAAVEVCVDGGDGWKEARVVRGMSQHAWCSFAIDVTIDRPGRHVLRARARDGAGNVQPDEPSWNQHGYGNNAVVPVILHVV